MPVAVESVATRVRLPPVGIYARFPSIVIRLSTDVDAIVKPLAPVDHSIRPVAAVPRLAVACLFLAIGNDVAVPEAVAGIFLFVRNAETVPPGAMTTPA